jgi:hypothetical protein
MRPSVFGFSPDDRAEARCQDVTHPLFAVADEARRLLSRRSGPRPRAFCMNCTGMPMPQFVCDSGGETQQQI